MSEGVIVANKTGKPKVYLNDLDITEFVGDIKFSFDGEVATVRMQAKDVPQLAKLFEQVEVSISYDYLTDVRMEVHPDGSSTWIASYQSGNRVPFVVNHMDAFESVVYAYTTPAIGIPDGNFYYMGVPVFFREWRG